SGGDPEELLQWELLQRLHPEIRRGEIELLRHLVRNRETEESRRLRGRDAVRRVLDRDGLPRLGADRRERLLVEDRTRFRARLVSIRGEDHVPHVRDAEAAE